MKLMGIQELRKRSLPIIDIPENIAISSNTKTGISINLPIAKTCQPTKECKDYCYGTIGPIAFRNSLIVQERNYARFSYLETATEEEVDKECHNIASKVKNNWVRWNGVGDLIPGSVRVINRMTELYPIVHWITTRKVKEASKLRDHESIRILFSLDAETPKRVLQEAMELKQSFQKAKFRFAYVRRKPEDVPSFVDIIFNEHGKRRLNIVDERTCLATLPNTDHKNACDNCRRCFA
jgi:hypothetical protein